MNVFRSSCAGYTSSSKRLFSSPDEIALGANDKHHSANQNGRIALASNPARFMTMWRLLMLQLSYRRMPSGYFL
jgi:hypothetical protein